MTARAPSTASTARTTASTTYADSSSSLEAFEKLFASVTDPQTRENHQRHLALTKNVLYQNEQGYQSRCSLALSQVGLADGLRYCAGGNLRSSQSSTSSLASCRTRSPSAPTNSLCNCWLQLRFAPRYSISYDLAILVEYSRVPDRAHQPFVRQKANEEILNPSLLHGILPTLGDLLSSENINLQLAAAEALRQFAIGACKPIRCPISVIWGCGSFS